jgi:hypothetical protein
VIRNKYHSKPCIVTEDGTLFEVAQLMQYGIKVEGIRFDSKMEAEYYLVLKEQLRQGIIQDIILQPRFILQDSPKIEYRADFQIVYPGGDMEVIDVKGMQTKEFKVKKKLFAKVYEDYKLTLVTRKGRRWVEV